MSDFERGRHTVGPLALAALVKTATALGLARPMANLLVRQMNSPRRKARAFRGYTPSAHDVFAATFSKSGTNWILQICQQIAWRGDAAFDHIHSVCAWPEAPIAGVVPLDDPAPWRDSAWPKNSTASYLWKR